jgi:hypothetical protein
MARKILIRDMLYIIGGLIIFWALVCLIGGPDGKRGSTESLMWGLGYLFCGGIIILLGRIILKTETAKRAKIEHEDGRES